MSKDKTGFEYLPQRKKDRKFSENIHDAMKFYEGLRVDHLNEEKKAEKDLTDIELHRLRKIHAIEEAKCMLQVLEEDTF
jgi:hypothetical protein